MTKAHSFHIPVLGIGFTIDTPLKVAHLGIDSVVSIVDDILLERLRKMLCDQNKFDYHKISKKDDDYRAKRITSYLNLLNKLVKVKFDKLIDSASNQGEEFNQYLKLLPSYSSIKRKVMEMSNSPSFETWLRENLKIGSIDVNIMTKVDKTNFRKKAKLSPEYNDAHAALRGFANSDLNSSLVLSAGMSPRLYSYIEEFNDFYPDQNGFIKKKIVLKVSDYRSALIQGKFFAKKGLWVSEFRIESGLNCGGHAFATDGFLLGPILDEFKDKRQELQNAMTFLLEKSLAEKDKPIPDNKLNIKISAQGGVGTSEEHHFLIDHYNLDSIGWGTPFLLVPEATNVDDQTLEQLQNAKENDLYLSNISPLGVPFHSLKGNTKDEEKDFLLKKGKPGSSCPKEFLALNSEYSDKGICTASRKYQKQKIKELQKENLPLEEYNHRFNKIISKACICVGLGTSVLLKNKLSTKVEGDGVSICPGPNMAYFSDVMSLDEMVGHIYGRTNKIRRKDRPNMYLKELQIYIDYYKNKIKESRFSPSQKDLKQLCGFGENLKNGINYYLQLFEKEREFLKNKKNQILMDFAEVKKHLEIILKDLNSKLEY